MSTGPARPVMIRAQDGDGTWIRSGSPEDVAKTMGILLHALGLSVEAWREAPLCVLARALERMLEEVRR